MPNKADIIWDKPDQGNIIWSPPATAYDIRDQERPDVGVKEGLSITGDVLGTFMGGGLAKSLKFAPRVLPYAGRVLGSLVGGMGGHLAGQKIEGEPLDIKGAIKEGGIGAIGEAVMPVAATPAKWVVKKVAKPLAKALSGITGLGYKVSDTMKKSIVKRSTDRALKFVSDLAPDIVKKQDIDMSTLGTMVDAAMDEKRVMYDIYEDTLRKHADLKEGGLVPIDDVAQFLGKLKEKAEQQLLKEGSTGTPTQIYTRTLKMLGHTKSSAPALMKGLYTDLISPADATEIAATIFKKGKRGYGSLTPQVRELRKQLKERLISDFNRLSPEVGVLKTKADEATKAIANFQDIKKMFDASIDTNKFTGESRFLPAKFADLVYSNRSRILKDDNLKAYWPVLKKEADYYRTVAKSFEESKLGPLDALRPAGSALGYAVAGGAGIPIVEGMGGFSAYALMSPKAKKALQALVFGGTKVGTKAGLHIGGQQINFEGAENEK